MEANSDTDCCHIGRDYWSHRRPDAAIAALITTALDG
jgi:hypothetical protein